MSGEVFPGESAQVALSIRDELYQGPRSGSRKKVLEVFLIAANCYKSNL